MWEIFSSCSFLAIIGNLVCVCWTFWLPFSLFGLSGKHIHKCIKPSRAVSGCPLLLLRCHVLKIPQCLHTVSPKRDHIWDVSYNSTLGSIDSWPSHNVKCPPVSVLSIFFNLHVVSYTCSSAFKRLSQENYPRFNSSLENMVSYKSF